MVVVVYAVVVVRYVVVVVSYVVVVAVYVVAVVQLFSMFLDGAGCFSQLCMNRTYRHTHTYKHTHTHTINIFVAPGFHQTQLQAQNPSF